MATGVRRVGGVSEAEQTYTLGPEESFRLDAVSYTINYANEGSFVIPTLIVRDSGGSTIAEITPPALYLSPPGLGGFAYTGPAVLADDYDVLVPDGYNGYLMHDFGAGVTTAHMSIAWTQPPGLEAGVAIQWLRSPGAVTLGPIIGETTDTDTDTIAVTLTAGVAAGHFLMLHCASVDPAFFDPNLYPRPTVTDTVGGNFLEGGGFATSGYAATGVKRADNKWVNSIVFFYRIVNALHVGDTVTLTRPQGPASWLNMRGHDLNGPTLGNPIGPNVGGNYIGVGTGSVTSPIDILGASPVPKWAGGVVINSLYVIAVGGTANVMLCRGGVETQPVFGSPAIGATTYVQAALPELHLGPFDTLTATSFDTLGQRNEDSISNFLVYGVDE